MMDKKVLAICKQYAQDLQAGATFEVVVNGEGNTISNIEKTGTQLIITKSEIEEKPEIWIGTNEELQAMSDEDKDKFSLFITTDDEGDITNISIDNETIVKDENDMIKAVSLDGMEVGVDEINFLEGLTFNVAEKFASITNPLLFRGVYDTYADLPKDAENGNVAIVKDDENNDYKQMTYIFSTEWEEVSENEIELRDFSIDKIDLESEVKGVLPIENVETSTLAKLTDIANFITDETPISIKKVGEGKFVSNIVANGHELTLSLDDQFISELLIEGEGNGVGYITTSEDKLKIVKATFLTEHPTIDLEIDVEDSVTMDFGDTNTFVSDVKVDDNGHVLKKTSATITLPNETELTLNEEGTGNRIESISVQGHNITVQKVNETEQNVNVAEHGTGEFITGITAAGNNITVVRGDVELDGKVKVDADSESKYISEIVDDSTIDVEGGYLVAKNLQGLNVGVGELNFIQGLNYNLVEKLNTLSNPLIFLGVYNNFSELEAIDNVVNGNVAIVREDENNNNKQMTYIYSTQWEEVSENTIELRDFATNPIDLETETTSILPISKVDTSTLAKLVDIANFITTETPVTINVVGEGSFITGITASNHTVTVTKGEVDLEGKLPTKTSDLTNDSGFLTEHQDITGKVNSEDLATVATTGSYNDLLNKPTIPTKTSQLTNDSNLVNKTYVASEIAKLSTSSPVTDQKDYVEQVTTMPANGSVAENYICQYVGTTTDKYTNGFFYKWTYEVIDGNKKWDWYRIATTKVNGLQTQFQFDTLPDPSAELYGKVFQLTDGFELKSGNFYKCIYNKIGSKYEWVLFSEGKGTYAQGAYSHAEGITSYASGDYSHAENNSTASGKYSHAEGRSVASGECSHAEGLGTKAKGANQHVSGKYNTEDTNSKYAEIVGNGSSDDSRSNCRTLDWSGNETITGTMKASDFALTSGASLVKTVSSTSTGTGNAITGISLSTTNGAVSITATKGSNFALADHTHEDYLTEETPITINTSNYTGNVVSSITNDGHTINIEKGVKALVQKDVMTDGVDGDYVQYIGESDENYKKGRFYYYSDNKWNELQLTDSEEPVVDQKQYAEQVSVMPELTIDSIDKIVQYIGETTENYTNGLFYKGVEVSKDNYTWEEVELSKINSVATNFQYEVLPTPNSSNENTVVQYVGTSNNNYITGEFYQCICTVYGFSWRALGFHFAKTSNSTSYIYSTNNKILNSGTNKVEAGVENTITGDSNTVWEGNCNLLFGENNNVSAEQDYYDLGHGYHNNLVGGKNNKMSSCNSLVFGEDNTIIPYENTDLYKVTGNSLVFGKGNKCDDRNAIRFGKYCSDASDATSYLEKIGIGTSDADRKDARSLDDKGNEKLSGYVTATDFKINNGTTTTSVKNKISSLSTNMEDLLSRKERSTKETIEWTINSDDYMIINHQRGTNLGLAYGYPEVSCINQTTKRREYFDVEYTTSDYLKIYKGNTVSGTVYTVIIG